MHTVTASIFHGNLGSPTMYNKHHLLLYVREDMVLRISHQQVLHQIRICSYSANTHPVLRFRAFHAPCMCSQYVSAYSSAFDDLLIYFKDSPHTHGHNMMLPPSRETDTIFYHAERIVHRHSVRGSMRRFA